MEVVKSIELEETILKDQKKAIKKNNYLRGKILYYEKRAKILTTLTRFFIVVGLMFLILVLWSLFVLFITPWYERRDVLNNIGLFTFWAVIFLMPVEFLRVFKDKIENDVSVLEEELYKHL